MALSASSFLFLAATRFCFSLSLAKIKSTSKINNIRRGCVTHVTWMTFRRRGVLARDNPAVHWAVGMSYNASYSGQSGGTTTNLLEVQAFGERFLNRNSFVLGLSDFLHSSQQDLQLRTTLGGGYGRYLVRTNQNELRWLIGADYTHASYQSGLGGRLSKTSNCC